MHGERLLEVMRVVYKVNGCHETLRMCGSCELTDLTDLVLDVLSSLTTRAYGGRRQQHGGWLEVESVGYTVNCVGTLRMCWSGCSLTQSLMWCVRIHRGLLLPTRAASTNWSICL